MEKFKKSILPITTFVRIDVKRLFRDKVAIFFVFIFPLIFLLIFGSIFSGDRDVSFDIALINRADNSFAQGFSESLSESQVFNVGQDVSTEDQANDLLSKSQLDALIILPESFGVIDEETQIPAGDIQVYYAEANQSTGQALGSVLDSILKDVNAEFVDTSVPFGVNLQSTAIEGLTSFDYTFAGIMGFTLLSLGVFGPTSVFPRLKQRGVLRRYKTTGIKVWQYFVGNVISNGFTGILAAAFMFMAAVSVFGLEMRGDYLSLLLVILLGTFMLFGIGLAIGGWADNENQAAPVSQLVALPMMFLSGVFFPTFLMPDWLQSVTQFIPLTPVVEAIRLVVTEGKTILEIGPEITAIAGWTVIIYLLAFKLFDWE